MHITICVPLYEGKVHLAWMSAFVRTNELLLKNDIKLDLVSICGCGLIHIARAEMVTMALKTEAEIIIFIDSKQLWMPETILRLIRDLKKYPAVAAPVANRHLKYSASYTGEEDGLLKKAHFSAIAFMGMRREVLEKMREVYKDLEYDSDGEVQVDLFQPYLENRKPVGEDMAFSKRLVDSGIDLWVDEGLRITRINE